MAGRALGNSVTAYTVNDMNWYITGSTIGTGSSGNWIVALGRQPVNRVVLPVL